MTMSRDWAALASQNERIAEPADTLPEGTLGAVQAASPEQGEQARRSCRAVSLLQPARLRRGAA
jgi:hypothetical protein